MITSDIRLKVVDIWIEIFSDGISKLLIVIEQIIERHPRDFVWPLFFEDFHILGVVSVLFVFTAALTDLISSRYEKGSTN